jgi:hypothetical protein
MARIEQSELYQRAEAIKQWASANRMMGTRAPIADPGAMLLQPAQSPFAADEEQVLMRKGLTAVGISEKREAIVLYTNRPLAAKDRRALPDELFGGVPVYYRRATAFTLRDEVEEIHPGIMAGRYHNRRYACGASISIANRRTAATLGCLVRDAEGQLFGLTNNHVTGGCNNTRIDMQVLAPGVKDVTVGEHDPFTIGYHARVAPMAQGEPGAIDHKRNSDAALIRIADHAKVTSSQSGHYDTPGSPGPFIADPRDGSKVYKVGRTTGLTEGIIESRIVGAYPVDYNVATYHNASDVVTFQGRVYFEPVYLIRGSGGAFAGQGDSGSLVVADDGAGGKHAVGLIFAGNEQEETSYMLPIEPILKALNVSLVSGHGT